MSEPTFEQVAFGEATPGQRLPVLLVLDTSSSMEYSGRIQAMRRGLAKLHEMLNSDDVARVTAEIAVLTFDSEIKLVHDFALPPAFAVPEFVGRGQTFMGRAIIEGLDIIEQRKKYLREAGNPYLRPIMMLLTDGNPEGEPPGVLEQATAKIRDHQAKRRLRVWPICVGEDIDPRQLSTITGTDALRLDETKWMELFIWVSSGLKSASRSTDDKGFGLAPPSWTAP